MTSSTNIDSLLERMAADLTSLASQRRIEDPVMIGIQTGGVWIAQRLHDMLKITEPLGRLDISFYRDDFTRMGMNPQVKPSYLPFNLDERHIILVDDVLHTGRTIRAALNEIFDYGRPGSVTLAVLVERSGRELPIEAAVVGQHLELAREQHVKLTGPDPLGLVVQTL
ncbi:MAG: bifunctional pyr operon transcriptional regulator/uracil phosphoribosyltransferase PyrR [Gammaproteobacteria bacterium]